MKPRKKPEKTSPVLLAFQKHRAPLQRFISRFVYRTHDIDDIAQEAFLRAYSAEQLQEITQPKSYLFRIAHNIAVTELSRKSNQLIDYIEEIDDTLAMQIQPSAEDEAMAEQAIGVHCEAVAKLPPQCRRVYLMRKVHGMSHQEIAQRLGIATTTVERHLTKGIRDCNRYMEEHMGGADRNGGAQAVSGVHSGGNRHG